VPLQLGEIVEGIGSVQLAGVNQAHEQSAARGAVAAGDRFPMPEVSGVGLP
jgi:hypothetical protein